MHSFYRLVIVRDEERGGFCMEPVGARVVLLRERPGPFEITVPEWVADNFGELIVATFDGETITITDGGAAEWEEV